MKKLYFILLVAFISFNCQKEITAPESLIPTITTASTTSITNTTALSGGNITDDGGAGITARGVCWSITANPVVSGNHTTDGTGTGVFTSNITGLVATTTYHVRAYATNSSGTAYGADSTFTTTSSSTALPTVTTSLITGITTINATGGGNVTADGGATVTARGVCWATTVNPDITGNHTTDGNGTGIFTSAITGLTLGTTYHVRAYATNSLGTVYGGDSVFTATTATASLPTVTTATVGSITALTASGGGTVTADGGAAVTVRGICWSTSANPVATGNHTTDGSGIGTFAGFITGLTAGTTYHVRAYATNNVGTAYGGDSVFTTSGGSSGTKIKRIIQSVTGTRQAYITALTYDASNRLLTFKEWEEDSTFTPIKITGAHYSAITYNGTTAYPIKNTITSETAGIDSTIYSYDASNRVIEEKYYHNGNVSVRNTYSYLSATSVVLGKYVLSGPTLLYMGNDTLIFDAQQRVTGYNSGNASNVATGTGTYQYDSKNNPFALIDFFKHAYTLYCDDAKYFYRAPNNFTMFNQSTLPSGSTTISINYVAYNPGFYPEYATGSLVNVPGSTQNYTIRYEYY